MRSFFSQFGDIRALKLSRSKKTARSKGYAFIEFEDLETATIVAETMNNYMMFGQTLKAHVLEQRHIHPDLFKGVDALSKFRKMPHKAIARSAHNKPRTESQDAKRLQRLKKAEEKKRAQIESLGIKYAFPGYAGDSSKAPDADQMQVDDEPKKSKSNSATASASTKKADKKDAPSAPKSPKSKPSKAPVAAPSSPVTAPTPAAKTPAKSAKKAAQVAPTTETKKANGTAKKAAATPAPSAKKQKTKQ